MSKSIFKEYSRWLNREDLGENLNRELESIKDDKDAIYEAFYRDLDFGTSGLRGIMGVGTNRMNAPVVRRVSQGVANYLYKEDLPKKVVVCYDSRHNSRTFAEKTAAVFAANGIKVYMYRNIMPVSACSYGVCHYDAGCGIMITASHNPKEYNGYKVYGRDGCQITEETTKKIFAETEKVDIFNGVKSLDFTESITKEIEYIPETVENMYVKDGLKSGVSSEDTGNLKVVYTPLHGTGNVPVRKILNLAGMGELHIVKSQEMPDGDFPTCILPNPEDPRVFDRAKAVCDENKCDIILATDPDCDRVGLMQRTAEGYIRPRGNEIGILLFDYICRNKKLPVDPVMVTTVVSSDMIDRIAADYGVEVERTLIGFKYIGKKLEALGKRYVFGFEEGYGYLAGDFVRDKDGVSSSLLIAQMTAYHKRRGKNLKEALDEIYQLYGYYGDRVLGFEFDGSKGIDDMKGIMNELRKNDTLWGKEIDSKLDYMKQSKLPKSNILEYRFKDGSKVLIRPSGTEPKMKAYLFSNGKDRDKVNEKLNENEEKIRKIIKNG